MSDNQVATADAAFTLGAGNEVYDRVLNMSEAQAHLAMNALSGEIHASVRSRFVDSTNRISAAALQRMYLAERSEGYGAWVELLGGSLDLDGNRNAASLNGDDYGLLVGVDTQLESGWRVGLFGGGSYSDFDIESRASNGVSDNLHLGAYASNTWSQLSLHLGLGYSHFQLETERHDVLDQELFADYDATGLQGFVELAYRIDRDSHWLQPFVNLSYIALDNETATERGGSAALLIQDHDTGTGFSTLGMRSGMDFVVGDTDATLHGSLGWKHGFGDIEQESRHAFASGGDGFTIHGAPLAENGVEFETGVAFRMSNSSTLGLRYRGNFANEARSQDVRLHWELRF